ncbi:hypothetical protein G3N55_09755, partial [Dissulfurirhabdus thermomarina]
MSTRGPAGGAGAATVVAGLGAVSPLGAGRAALWAGAAAGRAAFGPIRLFDTTGHRTGAASEVTAPPEPPRRRLPAAELSRADRFALAAAAEALSDAGLLDPETGLAADPDMGIVVGTAAGGILGLEAFFRARFEGRVPEHPRRMLASFALSAVAANLAREFGIRGPRLTTATVCSSSGLALAAAHELLRWGAAARVLVVGAEGLSEVTHAGFNSLRAVAPDRCRPFDRDRRGLVLGEGAGAVVLERRPARPGEVVLRGYGLTTDLHHFTAPEPKGEAVAATLRAALDSAGLGPADVDYVNAHGTGTPLNDAAEARGIAAVLGKVPVSSSKSVFGHALGAASALEALVTARALREETVPPTAGLEAPDPACAGLDLVRGEARRAPLRHALSNSFAFGGSNVALAFSREAGAEAAPASAGRPVITGMGAVSPFGPGVGPLAEALREGRTGLRDLAAFGAEWGGFLGGAVDLEAVKGRVPPARRRHLNRMGLFLEAAVDEALASAGIEPRGLGPVPLVYGSAFGCAGNVHGFFTTLLAEGPRAASPQDFKLSVTNAPAALAAQRLGIHGPVWVFSADEASWEAALHWGCDLVRRGGARRVVVAAAEELGDAILAIHRALGFVAPGPGPGYRLGEG